MGSLPGQGTQVRVADPINDTVRPGDHEGVIDCRGSVALLMPRELPRGFNCKIAQTEIGQVKLVPQSGAGLRGTDNKIAGNGKVAELLIARNDDEVSADYFLSGQTGVYDDTTPWVARTAAAVKAWRGIAWSDEQAVFAAVSQSSTTAGAMTSADGVTWASHNLPATGNWSVTWCPAPVSLFVAVSSANNVGHKIITSPDGVTWTERAEPDPTYNGGWFADPVYSEELGLIVVVGSDNLGTDVMTSADGITWEFQDTPIVAADYVSWESIAWSPELGLFVVTGDAGFGFDLMTSPDGVNWTVRESPVGLAGNVVWSSELGLFVVALETGGDNIAATSADGLNWTFWPQPDGYSHGWGTKSPLWVPELGLFVVITLLTSDVAISSDGKHWSVITVPEANFWFQGAWSPSLGIIAAVSSNGTHQVMTSNPLA